MHPLLHKNIKEDLTYLKFLIDLVDGIIKSQASPCNTEEMKMFAASFRCNKILTQATCILCLLFIGCATKSW